MFNLEKRERFIILFLIVTLLAGLSVMLYRNARPIIDVKIRAFDYTRPSGAVKKININEADEAALAGLPGVGKALALRIIEYRTRQGDFRFIEEIKKVKGIKDNLFEKIKDGITIE